MQSCKDTSAFQAVSIYIKILFYRFNLCLLEQENSLLIWHWGKSSQKRRIKSAVFQHCLPFQLVSLIDQEQPPVSASLPTTSFIPATASAAPGPPSSIPRSPVKGRGLGSQLPTLPKVLSPLFSICAQAAREEVTVAVCGFLAQGDLEHICKALRSSRNALR